MSIPAFSSYTWREHEWFRGGQHVGGGGDGGRQWRTSWYLIVGTVAMAVVDLVREELPGWLHPHWDNGHSLVSRVARWPHERSGREADQTNSSC